MSFRDFLTEQARIANQYKSINDDPLLPKGNTEIWYMKGNVIRNLGAGSTFIKKHIPEKMPTKSTYKDTHVLLGKIKEKNLEAIFDVMNRWSPEGQAGDIIKKSGTEHTSMMVGDIIKIGSKIWMVDNVGFIELK